MVRRQSKKQGTSTPRSRGAYGSKRGTPDKQNAKTRNRMAQGRVQDSAAEVKAAQDRLDRRIARERHTPTMGAAAGALYAEETRALLAPREAPEPAPPPPAKVRLQMPADRPWFGEPKPGFTVWFAREQVRRGYRVEHVIALTGVGMQYLSDLPLGEDGRILVEEEPEPASRAEARREQAELRKYAQMLVRSWPDLSPEQRARLRLLINQA